MDLTDDVSAAVEADASWTILIALALGVVLALLAWSLYTREPRLTRYSTRSFWCPFRGKNVIAEFREEAAEGTPVAVESCDAFSPPSAVACEKLCLRLRRLPPLRNGIS